MAVRTVFNNLAAGNQPLSLLDQEFADYANFCVLPCTCSGTNQLTLTPMPYVPQLTNYGFLCQFSFVAQNTSTGNVTIAVAPSLPQLPAYANDGQTQVAAGQILAGVPYTIQYANSLQSGLGGFCFPDIAPATGPRILYLPGFVTGLVIKNGITPTTQINVTALQALMSIPNGSNNIYRTNVSVVINTGTIGANGLDTGGLPTSNWIYIYLIDNGATTAGLISVSSTNPTLPGGYTYVQRVGAMYLDGSSHLLNSMQAGSRGHWMGNTVIGNSSGGAVGGGVTTPTWAALQVRNGGVQAVPPTGTTLRASAIAGVGYLADGILVAPNNTAYGGYNSTTNPPPIVIYATSGANPLPISNPFEWVLQTDNIYWATAGTHCIITALGWADAVPAV